MECGGRHETEASHPRIGDQKTRRGERLLNQDHDVAEVCRHLEITQSTRHRWRNQYGDMRANDAKRLKELGKENTQLKSIVAT